jgi:hypothetical protein
LILGRGYAELIMSVGRLVALTGLIAAGCLAGEDPSRLVGGPARYGYGTDGPIDTNGDMDVSGTRTIASGAAGASELSVVKSDGFAAGNIVLVHDTQGAHAGTWELALIASVRPGVLVLSRPLAHSYPATDHAQAVRIFQHDVIDINAGTEVTGPKWDGNTGGIIALMAQTGINIAGSLAANGAGFRGTRHEDGCPMTYSCMAGVSGESSLGAGQSGRGPNGAGGGGGGVGECNQGGGGAHGVAGSDAAPSSLAATDSCAGSSAQPGKAGLVAADARLGDSILFGGAGGEGGGDDDSLDPGGGGNGGGIIMLFAPTINVTGTVAANGDDGRDGTAGNRRVCVGGCGSGGGGGGAGGAIYFVGNQITVSGSVTALGGGSGACSCAGVATDGGEGGVGRIAVRGQLGGVTKPPFAVE